jgi:DNA polymerase I
MPTLYLIDGYAQFFRAYHAIRTPMSSPVTKEPTNMTFGFVGMLLKLLRGEGRLAGRPDFLAVALDVSGDRGTFRSQLYPEYKAHRDEPPEDLEPQVDRCLALLKTVGVPTIGAEGFEADDVIATVVDRLRTQHPDLRIRIISKDKDLKQLLEPGRVELFDVHTDQVIDADALKADTGLEPSQVVDMLTLMGDTADNVPGVEGVGPKTAAQLLVEHGTLDNLLKNADKVPGKKGEKLREAAPRLALSKSLVTLRRDTPVELSLDEAAVDRFNLPALGPILKELGFNRFQDELKQLTGGPPATVQAAAATPASAKPAARARPADTIPFGSGLFDALVESPASAAVIKPQSGEYRALTSERELAAFLADARDAEIVSVDTETTGLSPLRDKLCGVCLSIAEGSGVYIPVRSPKPKDHLDEKGVLAALRPILEDPARPKCGHNLKFDALVLRAAGVRVRGLMVPATGCFDSMIASYLIDAERSSHSLDALAMSLLGRTNISIKDLIGTGKDQRTFDTVPLELATQYAAEDADVALQLRARMLPQLRAMGLMDLFSTVEMPLVDVLAELEFNGIRVDPAELERQRARLQARIDAIKREIDDESMTSIGRTFNPDSPKQLATVLFNAGDDAEPGLGLKPVKKIKTGYSTDAEVLDKLAADPLVTTKIPALIVDHRELTKLVGTYLVALKDEINPATGRIHASFNQTVAATGRLSSSDPNLQNIPIRTDVGREIRRAFVAEPGWSLVSADYSQIELRLLAHLSRDPNLIQAFLEGQDIHAAVAAQIHSVPIDKVTREQRSGAKMVNFGIVYGITAFGLARRLGVSNTAAEEIITGYKKRFAGITTFLQECVEQARRFGYVETMLKRRRPIADIESTNPSRRALAERTAINSVVQGSAADLIKLAMVNIQRDLEAGTDKTVAGTRMLLQIHDELVFEAPDAKAEAAKSFIVRHMESAMSVSVPLRADASIAKNWFEGK